MRFLAKTGVKIALIVGVILAITIGVVYVKGFYSETTADKRGEIEQREDTVADGTYRISAYERFYDMCAAVQSAEDRIANAETELESGPSESRESQLHTTLQALRNQRSEAINEYNAEARKEDTAANFRASDLPPQIDPEEDTTCTVESS